MNARKRLEERAEWIRGNVNKLAKALRPDQTTWTVTIGTSVLSYLEVSEKDRTIVVDTAVWQWSNQEFDKEATILIGFIAVDLLQAS